jgi:23S rRNA pseudouridine1911/1915/1917 synthase
LFMPIPRESRLPNTPYILDETEHFAVVYKPPFLHSAPLKKDIALPRADGAGKERGCNTLLDWYALAFPGIRQVCGRNVWEGGILHRLDFETQGLVLFAKTLSAMDALLVQQNQGAFIKEYGALSPAERRERLPGFPPVMLFEDEPPGPGVRKDVSLPPAPFCVESAFRPYGPGRKAVRPFIEGRRPLRIEDQSSQTGTGAERRLYQTEIVEWEPEGKLIRFKLRIKRGFRHQIRCHLAWLGYPILNDALYGSPADRQTEDRILALKAETFTFYDPANNEKRVYRMD